MDLLTIAEEAEVYFKNGTPICAGSELANEMSHVPGKLQAIYDNLIKIREELQDPHNMGPGRQMRTLKLVVASFQAIKA